MVADKVIDQFDIVPLTWVKGEIDLALDSVRDNIATLIANPTELSPLRFSKTHLYQITGAFDIVGLEGCKRFCFEIERLHNAFEKQTVPLNKENLTTLRSAVDALSQYLQDLANGQPDIPFRLFPALARLMALQGEEAEESELFFVDTSARIPDNLLMQDPALESSHVDTNQLTPVTAIQLEEQPVYYGQQRHLFQRSLLKWLTGHSEVGLTGMRHAIDNVQISQANPKQKALWWALSAFVETLQQPSIAEKISAKKLCRRVDQQIRHLVEGNTQAPSHVLKDALYYVAISEPISPKINQVKQTFALESALSKQRNAAQAQVKASPNAGLISGLLLKIEQLKEMWSLAHEFTTLTERGALRSFHAYLSNMLPEITQLENEQLVTLTNAIHQFSDMLLTTQGRFTYDASIEVAAGLTLLEDALNDYQLISVDFLNRIDAQTKILVHLVENEGEIVGEEVARPLTSNVVPLALEQVKVSLQKAEQLLEPYFLTPQQFDLLLPVNDPLQQVFGSFELLNLPLPSAIVSTCAKVIRGIYDQDIPPEPATLECIASSLTAVSVCLDEFANPRPGTESNLQMVLAHIGGILPDQPTQDVQDLPKLTREVDSELLNVFITEAEEVLAHLAEQLKKLRIHVGDEVALGELRRGYHTLKGSGRTIGLHDLGEVAWIVEQILNTVIELKSTPIIAILDFIEARCADFAMWVSQLRASHSLQIDLPGLQAEAATLMGQQNSNPVSAILDEVVIGGTYKISRSLFDVFLEEAHQHLKSMKDDWLKLSLQLKESPEQVIKPSEDVQRAVHTLASTAGAAGFKAIQQLANVFEYWLQSHSGQWQLTHLSLYDSVNSAIRTMLERVNVYRQPRQAIGLLNVLNDSIEQLRKGATAKKKSMLNEVIKTLPGPALPHQVQEFQSEQIQEKPFQKAFDPNEGVDVKPVPEILSEKTSMIGAVSTSISQTFADQSRRNNYLAAITSENFNEKRVSPTLSLQAKSAVDDALLTLFLEEAKELVPSIGRELIAWQKDPTQQPHLDALQRGLHTLKGSARIANQDALGDAIHQMEGHLISATKGKVRPVDFNEIFSHWDRVSGLLYQFEYQPAVDAVEQYALTSHKAERRTQFLRLRADLLERLMNDAGEISIARSRVEREMRGFKQSSTDLTDSVMRLNHQLREMEIEADSQLQSRMAHLKDANEVFDPLEFDRYTRLQELTRMMAESVNDVVTIQHNLLQNLNVADSALAQQNRINRDLQHALMSIRMLPFSDIVERLQRTVRMTAREQGKSVELVLQGEQLEIDRSVLDKMGAPLEHLLRNAVAHGIEMPEQRFKAEKPELGTIFVQVSREHDEIVIRVKDDGAGINLGKVREQAMEHGLITEANNLSDNTLMQIIFEPGFSTEQDVTQISGRGVGLDSVRSEISALGGRIDVSNNAGEGAIFTIYLPVTLSVSQAVMVRVGAHVYALPSAMVLQVQKLKPKALTECYQNKHLHWSGQDYPLYYLPSLLGGESQASESQLYTPVLLLRTGSYQIALHVDEVITNQEVVIKHLGKQMSRVPGMLGATLLSDGKIALILNPVQLANRDDLAVGGVKTSHHAQKTGNSDSPKPLHAALPQVLVVDDSLTIRKVLSRLLEREGYQVILAKDGMDALQKLQEVIPEIILTDIEMPGMDGFELVRNIKADQQYMHVPLIMISSRTAQKHRKLAESLGVDLFLGKPVQEDALIAQINNLIVRSKVMH
jgi:chemosensory pili system protein ChpA (sensor histidine kinase/response regulator)